MGCIQPMTGGNGAIHPSDGQPGSNGHGRSRGSGRHLVTVHVNTERCWGGGERQTLLLARGLTARGHAAVIVARVGSPLADRARESRLPVRTIAGSLEFSPFAIVKLARILRDFRADVVHLHTPHAAAFGPWAARLAGTRVVLASRRAFPRRNQGPLARWKWLRSRCIVAVSEALRERLVDVGLPSDRIEVIRSGADVRRLEGSFPVDPRDAFGWPADSIVIASVGNLHTVKGQRRLVRTACNVLKKEPRARFFLAGDGPERMDLEAEIAACGLAGRFVLTGFREDAPNLLLGSDVFVLPSLSEGFPVALVEALSLGLPSVVTEAGGSREIAGSGDDACALVVPSHTNGHGDEMAAAILRLIDDDGLRRRLSGRGLERARLYTAERTVRDTESLYHRLLDDNGT